MNGTSTDSENVTVRLAAIGEAGGLEPAAGD